MPSSLPGPVVCTVAAGMGDETGDIAIADWLQCSIAGGLGQGVDDGLRIGAGSELDLPIDRHRGDQSRGHAARAHDQERAEQGEERHGESDTGRLADRISPGRRRSNPSSQIANMVQSAQGAGAGASDAVRSSP